MASTAGIPLESLDKEQLKTVCLLISAKILIHCSVYLNITSTHRKCNIQIQRILLLFAICFCFSFQIFCNRTTNYRKFALRTV